MPRRRRDDGWDKIEAAIKLILAVVFLLALGIGGVSGFAKTLNALMGLVLAAAVAVVVVGVLILIGVFFWKRRNSSRPPTTPDFTWHSRQSQLPSPTQSAWQVPKVPSESRAATAAPDPMPWTVNSIREALGEIDWYKFEKFCAALLRADGFQVERKGGAQPDGGVDLIVEKAGTRALIQCKHWRTWVVQEKVIREMLGSMTHFKVSQGAIYTLKGWTEPAHRFATEHAITLVNGDELAQSAAAQLSQTQLEELLRPREHHCPKCESPMVFREGNFTSFWGCSRYPVCRGKFNHSGAR